MHLADRDVQEFIQIWREEFGEEISPDKARHQARELLELYALLAGVPMPTPTPPTDSRFGISTP